MAIPELFKMFFLHPDELNCVQTCVPTIWFSGYAFIYWIISQYTSLLISLYYNSLFMVNCMVFCYNGSTAYYCDLIFRDKYNRAFLLLFDFHFHYEFHQRFFFESFEEWPGSQFVDSSWSEIFIKLHFVCIEKSVEKRLFYFTLVLISIKLHLIHNFLKMR